MTSILTSLILMWFGGLLCGIGASIRWTHRALRNRDDTIIKALKEEKEETTRLRAQVAQHIGK